MVQSCQPQFCKLLIGHTYFYLPNEISTASIQLNTTVRLKESWKKIVCKGSDDTQRYFFGVKFGLWSVLFSREFLFCSDLLHLRFSSNKLQRSTVAIRSFRNHSYIDNLSHVWLVQDSLSRLTRAYCTRIIEISKKNLVRSKRLH